LDASLAKPDGLKDIYITKLFFPCPYFLGFFKNCYLTLFLFQ
jgi:hypothetical protein